MNSPERSDWERLLLKYMVVDNTKGLEKAVFPVCRIKLKIWATDASGAMNLKKYKEWLDAIES